MQKANDEGTTRENASQADMTALVSEIVAAYVAGNTLASSELPALIRQVHEAVSGLSGTQQAAPEPAQRPAVAIKRSVSDDAVTCLECGVRHKMLRRHLMASHNLTPREYRMKWGLGADYPLIAPNYSAQRSELATKIGRGKRTRSPGPARRRGRPAATAQGSVAASASVPRRRGPGRPKQAS
jgi:predicted transcriptional regulator